MSARLAKEIAEHIEEATNASRNGARDTSFFELKVAGVKATLYAAEQQRIANLIAYVSLLEGQYRDAAADPEGWEWSTHEASLARRESAQQQIREGLGLS